MIIIALIFSILNLQPIDADNLNQVQQLSEITIVGGVNGIDFHPIEPTHLAIAQESGIVSVWDVSNREMVNQWQISEQPITLVEYLPNGKQIVYMTEDGQIAILDTAEVNAYLFPKIHNTSATTFAVGSNEWLVVGYWDGKVRMFDVDCRCLIHTLHNYNQPISTIDFSTDTDYLAYGSMTSIFLWELQSADIFLLNIFEAGELNDLEFNPVIQEPMLVDTFASVSNFMSIQTWNTLGFIGQEIEKIPQQMAYPDHMSFSPNGYLVAIVGKETTAGGGCNTNLCPVEIINLQDYSSDKGFGAIQIGSHEMWYSDVDFNVDGRLLASASQDGLIKIWGVMSE